MTEPTSPTSGLSESLSHDDVETLATNLERELRGSPPPGEHDADAIRLRLVGFYLALEDPLSALVHLEELLARESVDPMVLERATALLEHRAVAARVAERLSETYRRLGRIASEAATLVVEIDLARTPRREEAIRRLAAIKASDLDDAPGALALLEAVLADSPPDEPTIQLYSSIARSHNEAKRATQTLSRALRAEGDPELKATLAYELGTLHAELGDLRRAGRCFLESVSSEAASEATLAAARALLDIESLSGDPAIVGAALSKLFEMHPDPAERAAASRQLREVHGRLIPVLSKGRKWETLAKTLELHARIGTPEEAAQTLSRLGELYLEKLRDEERALDAFERCLAVDPRNAECRGALERMMTIGDRRARAASLLENLYRSHGDSRALLRVLTNHTELATSTTERLDLLGQRFEIFEQGGMAPAKAMETCAKAIRVALEGQPDWVAPWLERFATIARDSNAQAEAARVLVGMLGDEPPSTPERAAMAREAIVALAASGDAAKASLLTDRVLATGDVTVRFLSYLENEGRSLGPPERRRRLYQRALDAEKDEVERRRAQHVLAALDRDDLDDSTSALTTYQALLEEDPNDVEAILGLVVTYERLGNFDAALEEIESSLELIADSAIRQAFVQRKARLLSKTGKRDESQALLSELLDDAGLSDAEIEVIATSAYEDDAIDLYRAALERLTRSSDTAFRTKALERLGDLLFERMGDGRAAVQSWLPAARLRMESSEDPDEARQLYERVLDVTPNDCEAAERLIELSVRGEDWSRVPDLFRVLLEHGTDRLKTVHFLADLRKSAVRAAATEEFVAMVDEALGVYQNEPDEVIARLMRSKARARAADAATADRASESYRALVERFGDERDVLDFERFIESKSSADERHDDLRWLYAWRADRADDPAAVWLAWAKAEDEFGYVDEAVELYERIADRSEGHSEALEALARLRAQKGDVEGALDALERLRSASPADAQPALERRIAALLADELGRPEDAIARLAPRLAASPPDEEALAIARRALTAGCSQSAVERIEDAIEASEDARSARANLELLIDSPRGSWLSNERVSGWYERLASFDADDLETAVEAVKRGISELPASTRLWEALERLARRLDRPQLLASVYQQTLDTHALEPETVEVLGRRVVDFCEEWSAGDPSVVTTLAHVLGRVPGARWALDRVKVALAAEGRWDDLFDLYDAAIANSDDDDTRARLLEEAAVAARDLAGAPECAMGYLERLHALRPDDMTTQASLERLYQRHGLAAKLIELLTERLDRATGGARREIETRLAELCVDVGDLDRASELLEAALGDGASVQELVPLLESIVQKAHAGASVARDRALDLLRSHYRSSGRADDVVRIAEIELHCASDPSDRERCLRELVALRFTAGERNRLFSRLLPEIGRDVADDGALVRIAAECLLEEAERRWRLAGDGAETDTVEGAWWATHLLVRALADAGEPKEALAVLQKAGALPFDETRRRSLRTTAAWIHSDRLMAPETAIAILSEVFDERSDDSIALEAETRYAELLEGAGRPTELAGLCSKMAAVHTSSGNEPAARAAWSRAADLFEAHGDRTSAIAAHRANAALHDDDALDALVRMHLADEDIRAAAEALEWRRVRLVPPDATDAALTLADLYERLGEPDHAVDRLESALYAEPTATVVRERLSAMYRERQDWEPLAKLLESGARYLETARERADALCDAAAIHLDRRGDAAQALGLLQAALELVPDDEQLQLSVGEALARAGRYTEAIAVFEGHLEAFGDRRPKKRAAVHQKLAGAFLHQGNRTRALEELKHAADIAPNDPELLYALARLALREELLDLAESTYRALALVLHQSSDPGLDFGRAEVFLDLGDIAARRGDRERGDDLMASAFDAALEGGPEAADRFERALAERGHPSLLVRALERRASSTADGTEAARILGRLSEAIGPSAASEHRDMLERVAKRVLRTLEDDRVTDASAWAAVERASALTGGEAARLAAVERRVATLLSAIEERTDLDFSRTTLEAARLCSEALCNPARSFDLCRGLFERDPANPELWKRLSTDCETLGRHAELEELVNAAAENSASDEERRRLRLRLAGVLLQKSDRRGAAITTLEQILNEAPDDAETLELLAEAYDADGRADQLAALLERQLRRSADQGEPAARANLTLRMGSALERAGRTKEATTLYEQLLSLDSPDPALLETLAAALDRLNSPHFADCLEQLLRTGDRDDRGETARRLLTLRERDGGDDAIERALVEAVRRNPGDPKLRDRLLARYEESNRWAEAVALLRSAVAQGRSPSLLARLVRAYDKNGERKNARDAAEEALVQYPTSAELFAARSRLREDDERETEALEDLEEAARHDPRFSPALAALLERIVPRAAPAQAESWHLRLADVLLGLGRQADARSALSTLLRDSPSCAPALQKLAALAVSESDWETAQSAYRRLLATMDPADPAFAELALSLATACDRNGQPAEARPALERAYAKSADNTEVRRCLERLYEQVGEHRGLADLLAVEAESQTEPGERADLLVRAAELFLKGGGLAARALQTAEEAHRVAPDHLGAVLAVARAHAALGRSAEARSTLEDAARDSRWRSGPHQSRLQLEVAKLYLESDDIFEAFDALGHAFRADQKNDEAALLLGLVAVDIDDERTATRALRSVTSKRSELSPESKAFAFYQLARLAQAKGDKRSMERMARASLKENPSDERSQALLDSISS